MADDEKDKKDERSEAGSISDRAANGEGEQEQLFPEGVLDGDKKTLANIMKKNLPVEVVCVMTQMEVPLRDGLPDPDKQARFAITVEPSGSNLKYVRERQPDGTRKVVGYKIVANVRPVFAEPLGMEEEAMTRSFEQLMGIDPKRAGKQLDALKDRFVEMMRSNIKAA